MNYEFYIYLNDFIFLKIVNEFKLTKLKKNIIINVKLDIFSPIDGNKYQKCSYEISGECIGT